MTNYIRVEDTVIYISGIMLCLLMIYFVMSMLVARNYTFAALKCKLTRRPMGIVMDKVGRARLPVLKYEKGCVEDTQRKEMSRYSITDNSLVRLPQGISAFFMMDRLGLTLQPQVLHATTALERLGISKLDIAEAEYLKNLIETAKAGGYFDDCKTDEEIEAKYKKLIDAGKDTLNKGGFAGDQFTMNLSTVYRWAKTEFSPTFNKVITEREIAKVRRELAKGMTVQKLATYVILAVILFMGFSIAYTVLAGSGVQMPNIPMPNVPMPTPL